MKKAGQTNTTEATSNPPEKGDLLVIKPPPQGADTTLPALSSSPVKMTKAEAVKAAREAGLQIADVGKWESYGKVGQYLQELGAVKVAAGQYAYHNRLRMHVMRLCRRAMGNAKDPEAVAKLADQMNKLLDSSDATIKELLRFVHTGVIKDPDDQPKLKLPPRGTPVVAVQVNTGVGEKEDKG